MVRRVLGKLLGYVNYLALPPDYSHIFGTVAFGRGRGPSVHCSYMGALVVGLERTILTDR